MSDAGMCMCENGHTFCESHQRAGVEELTASQKRERLIEHLTSLELTKWYTAEQRAKEIAELTDMDDGETEESYKDHVSDVGIQSEYCPVCQFEKVNIPEAFQFLLVARGIDVSYVLEDMKAKFMTYKDLQKFIAPSKNAK
jgi:hypothetical protein